MKNLLSKIQEWFASLWLVLKSFSAYWVSLLAIILMIVIGLVWYGNRDSDSKSNQNKPEIAQVFEPSIGEALPPTTEEFMAETPKPTEDVGGKPIAIVEAEAKAAAEASPEPAFVAPTTGINDEPVFYSNSKLGFSAELPAGATVKQISSNSIQFVPGDNGLLYLVQSYGKTSENIESIFAQIKGSSSVTSAKKISFIGVTAIQFTSKDIPGAGIAVISKGQLYYLIGDQSYFSTFQAI